MCIDPSRFGPLAAVKERSDKFINTVRNAKPRPGHRVRIPGEAGYRSLTQNEPTVEVLENHWGPFFDNIAAKYGLTESGLREAFANEQ